MIGPGVNEAVGLPATREDHLARAGRPLLVDIAPAAAGVDGEGRGPCRVTIAMQNA
jgi:hypothetical protein